MYSTEVKPKKPNLDCIPANDSLFKCKKFHFNNKLWRVIKSGYCTILWNGGDWCSKWNELPPTMPKVSLYPKKVMLCIWWDWKRVLYYEFFPEKPNNLFQHCSQLDWLKAALYYKNPELINKKGIIFHQDPTRPYVSSMTMQKLLQCGWEILIHSSYSPDIAPSDVHLFLVFTKFHGKNFSSLEDYKRHLEHFFAQKIQSLGKMELWNSWMNFLMKLWNYEIPYAWKMA